MRRFLHGGWLFVRDVFGSADQHRTFDTAAQLAYWAVLSLFPFTIFLLTVIGFLPLSGLDAELMVNVYRFLPGDAAKLIDSIVHEVLHRPRRGLLIVSLLGGLWTASGGVAALVKALNRAYGVEETRPFWIVKGEALITTLLGAVLAIVGIAAAVIGPGIVRWMSSWFGARRTFEVVWAQARWPLSVVAMMILLAFVYWVLPNVRRRFRLISPGEVFAVLTWQLALYLFKLYFVRFPAALTYGTLGAAIVMMTWFYFAAIIVILGGEINAAIDRAPWRKRAS